MTKRRLLQRLALLPLAALLCALLVACGGGPGAAGLCDDRSAAANPDAEAKFSNARTLFEAVAYTDGFISSSYIAPPDRLALLEAAWDGAKSTAMSDGIDVPGIIESVSPQLNGLGRDRVLVELLDLLSKNVEGKSPNQDIIDGTLNAMMKSLKDEHSYYLPRNLWDNARQGKVVVRGLYADPIGEGAVISEVIANSPAAGRIEPGDVVTAINGRPVSERPDVSASSDATFDVIKRNGGGNTKVVLPSAPVPWVTSRLLNNDTGYVRIYEFVNATSCDSFGYMRKSLDEALSAMAARGAKAWILDLRSNPGGHSSTAAYVAGRFGLEGLVLTLRTRSGIEDRIESLGNSAVATAPVVVLVNGGSASSSEVVAFALQDAGKAHVIGSNTAGAVVATVPHQVAGGAVFITTAFADVGRKQKRIDKVGVTPDKKVELDLDLLRREGRDSQLEAATAYLRQKLGH